MADEWPAPRIRALRGKARLVSPPSPLALPIQPLVGRNAADRLISTTFEAK
jgi:hypothetical protein